MKKVLFGAGCFATNAIKIIGHENVEYIVDNDRNKSGTKVLGVDVFSFEEKRDDLKDREIIISVSDKYKEEIEKQLLQENIKNYTFLSSIQMEITRKKIEERPDYIGIYDKAVKWIYNNTVENGGIICNSDKKNGYPEVSGYYIPSLLRWGHRELALQYAKWLIEIQKADGSWFDTDDVAPYVFDSGQILKGLLAIRNIYPNPDQIDASIRKGCDWIFSCMTEDGRLVTPSKQAWGTDENTCSEIIHIYCLSPLKEAGELFGKPEYIRKADKILEYYKNNYYEKIMNFSLLSHFYAYLMEALLDLGEVRMAEEAMKRMEGYQKECGAVPAYNNVDWVCSTGLFQLALVWFRLGEIERGNKAFEYACKLQNESGGWYGSYVSETNPNEINTYFPASEISWANKYFLDALYYKNKAEFNLWSEQFLDTIPGDDERYTTVRDIIKESRERISVLDVGCGKGRYLKNLITDCPGNSYFAVDISEKVMTGLEDLGITCQEGTLTNIPYENNKFAVTYTCEALEHAVDIKTAIIEMARVTQKAGIIIIIDKNDGCYGAMDICDWEQWPNEENLRQIMQKVCSDVEVRHGLCYENMTDPDLFTAWIGKVK